MKEDFDFIGNYKLEIQTHSGVFTLLITSCFFEIPTKYEVRSSTINK